MGNGTEPSQFQISCLNVDLWLLAMVKNELMKNNVFPAERELHFFLLCNSVHHAYEHQPRHGGILFFFLFVAHSLCLFLEPKIKINNIYQF